MGSSRIPQAAIILPEGLTEISTEAFYYVECGSIKIPDSVKIIGEGAFEHCSGSIKIPDSVEIIADRAFYDCSGSIIIGEQNNIREIGGAAFYNANIKHLNLDGVKCNNKNRNLFNNLPELETVVLKNITVEYMVGMFAHCPKLKSADLSEAENITNATSMFMYCTSLTDVKLPDSVTTLDYTFNGCTSLTKFAIPDSTTKIYMYELGSNRSLTVTYPKSIDDYRQISNSNVNKHFSPDAFGGDVNVTVTCADGKKVIYTSDGTMRVE